MMIFVAVLLVLLSSWVGAEWGSRQGAASADKKWRLMLSMAALFSVTVYAGAMGEAIPPWQRIGALIVAALCAGAAYLVAARSKHLSEK